MKVAIFHNVQMECRQCGTPARRIAGDDNWEHAGPADTSHTVRPCPTGFDGYQPGHEMVRVFETEVPDGQDPHDVAEQMFVAFNVGDDGMARAYRARRLRSLSIGDVVVVGESPLAVERAGFAQITGEFREVRTGEHGSVPLPRCSYCDATGDGKTLQPFNPAGNLACRDTRACSERMNGRAR